METIYYNVAADLYSRLLQKGESCVAQHIRENIWKYKSAIYDLPLAELEKELISLKANFADWIGKQISLTKDNITKAIRYLIILDHLSDNEWKNITDIEGNSPALNSAFRSEIEIFPTIPGIDRKGNSYDRIVSIFENLIFYKKNTEFEKLLEIKNFYIHLNYDQDSLKIGFAAYPFENTLPYITEKNKIKGKKKTELTDSDTKFLNSCEDLISMHNCDLIFAPEMHGSNLLDIKIKELIYNFRTNNLKAVICPSYHRQLYESGKECIKNLSTVYIRQRPHIRSAFVEKCFRADFSDGKQEALTFDADETTHSILLLHIHKIGRILVLICKDFIAEDINKLIDKLNVDIIIIQCYTDILTDFHQYASRIIRKRIILLGNSCRATKETHNKGETPNHPLIIYEYNFKHGKDGNPMKIINFKCETTCNYSCKSCCKVLEIKKDTNNTKDKNKTFSVNIVGF